MFQLFWKPYSLRFRQALTVFAAACFMHSGIPAISQIVPVLEPDNLISLKFANAPLDLVLDQYSDITGRTLIQSQGLNATITLKSKTKLTHTEALVAIESTLQMYNITFVPLGDKFLKVVQTANARTSGKEINIDMPEEPFPETDLLVSQVVTLKHIEFSEAKPILEQLKQSYGIIQELERTNSLLITDTAQNIKRMLQMLDYIDQPISIKEDIFVREIKYSKASEIASKLNELIEDSQSDSDSNNRITSPTPSIVQPRTPAGVIRARQAAAAQQAAQPSAPSAAAAAELAERGIIQGKVRIVADDRTGILFIISRPENFAFFDKIISVLDQAIDPQIEVRVLAMEYAEAEEVAGILNEFIGAASTEEDTPASEGESGEAAPEAARSQALRDFVRRRAQQAAKPEVSEEATEFGRLSPNTKILADPRTNSIMLMGRKADIAALEELIDQLDVMLGQVLIEAVILEVLLDDGVSHGVDWLQRSFIVNNEEKAGPGGGITVSQPVLGFGGGQNLSGIDGFIDGATVGRDTSIGSALTYYLSLYDLNLDAVVNLAANSSDARILSTPVIMTADNTEATITVGEERPVVSTTSTTTAGSIRSSFEYRNIGINLTVTPRINPERMVVMEIKQTADDVGGEILIDGNSVPIITKREFSAQVAVNNRETIVLGGLMRNAERDGMIKVPVLGDIPILGTLFRSQTTQEQRTELLVLLTPYVAMTPDEVSSETARLHDATQLRRTGWERGWSDSKLAKEPKTLQFHRKAETKQSASHKKKAKKSRPDETSTAEPKISPDIVFAEDLVEVDDSGQPKQTSEVIQKNSDEGSPHDLVPMYAPEEGSQVEILILESGDIEEPEVESEVEPVVEAKPETAVEYAEKTVGDKAEPHRIFTDIWDATEAPESDSAAEPADVSTGDEVKPDEQIATTPVEPAEEGGKAVKQKTRAVPAIRSLRERSGGPSLIPAQ